MNAQIKQKKCRVCKKPFTPFRSTGIVCSVGCAVEFSKVRAERTQKRQKTESRRELRAYRAKTKTLATLCAETQRDVNRYVRIRDQRKGCISCETGKVEDAGHFFPIGSKYRCNRLRFETEGIHGQCRKCNSYVGGGNLHGYIAGLEKRFGRAFVDDLYALKAKADQGLLAPLTKDEVRSIAAEHRKMIREMGGTNQ